MLRRLALMLVFALGALSAHARDFADPLKLIEAIYKTYRLDNNTNYAGLPDVHSRRLQGLLDADLKNTPKGEAGKIDWDVFVDGNDWALSDVKIARVAQTGKRAQVRAQFKNHRKPREILFDLVYERGRWRIDDIRSMLKPRWTMSKILLGDPDAFPDEKNK